MGFAGALSEVGLPGHAIPFALLFFNIGVELGQLLFIARRHGFVRDPAPTLVWRRPPWLKLVAHHAADWLGVLHRRHSLVLVDRARLRILGLTEKQSLEADCHHDVRWGLE
nr:HupE/UreJ family protein [Mesorhizobium sp.]